MTCPCSTISNVATPAAFVVSTSPTGCGDCVLLPTTFASSSCSSFAGAGLPCASVRVTVTVIGDLPSAGAEVALRSIETCAAAGPKITDALWTIATPSVTSRAEKWTVSAVESFTVNAATPLASVATVELPMILADAESACRLTVRLRTTRCQAS